MAQYISYSSRDSSGGGGGGTITAVTATSPLASSGGTAPDISLSGTVAILHGGTGQTTAPNAINALLPTQATHAGEFLTTDGSVASWTPGASPPGTANTFAGFDNSGVLESIPGFNIDTTGGLSEALTLHPNNRNGLMLNSWNVVFEPLQNSPDENWNIHNINTLIDPNSTGFTFGTNGTAINNINSGITNTGTSPMGALNFYSANITLGNGTDAVSANGVNYYLAYSNIEANATINTFLNGYSFQPTMQTGSIFGAGAGVSAFTDGANFNVPSNNHNSFSSTPNLFQINNTSNYNGFIANPNIATLQGNASVYGFGFYPAITTTGASSNVHILNANPTITTMGTNSNYLGVDIGGVITTMGSSSSATGFAFSPVIATAHGNVNGLTITPTLTSGSASFAGISINPATGTTTGSATGLSINLGNLTSSGDPQGVTGISSDSRIQLNANTQLAAAQTFQIGNRVESLFTVPSGSPVTGTDSLGNDFAGDLDAQDSIADGPTGGLVGWTGVGFISSVIVGSGKTVDTANIFLAACATPAPQGGDTDGGTITNLSMIKTAPPLNQGGSLDVTSIKALNVSGDFSSAAASAWGLYVEHINTRNHIQGNLDLGSLSMNGSSSGTLTHLASAVTTNHSLIWPAATAAGVLTNDGSGVLSWTGSVSLSVDLTVSAIVPADTVIIYDTVAVDTSSAYSTITGIFTVPTTGSYRVSAVANSVSGGGTLYIQRVNNTPANLGYLVGVIDTVITYSGTRIVSCTAGDEIAIYTDTDSTFLGTAPSLNNFSMELI